MGPDRNGSWFKLYRKIEKSPVFQNEGLLKVWIWCLSRARHSDEWASVVTGRGRTEVLVKRGQFVFGRKSAAKALKMDESTVYKRMHKLENMGNLNTESNTHFSIVTVLNYELYQGHEENEVTGVVTPKEHPSNTVYNYKKKKPYVETQIEFQLACLLLSEIRKNKPDFRAPNIQGWAAQMDLMIRKDSRLPDRIQAVIKWAQADHGNGNGRWRGWASNILSPGKLRDKFDQLEIGMQNGGPPGQRIAATQVRDLTGTGQTEAAQ